jgi:tetratricopeptide (TPR) repeat protein
MPEHANEVEAFFSEVPFGEMSDEEYARLLERNPDLRTLLEEERKGLFEGTVSLAQIMGVTDQDLLGAATAGADLLKEERWAEARAVFDGLTALEPAAPLFHLGLAQAYDGMGDAAKAIAAYTRTIDLADEGAQDDEDESRRPSPVIGDALYGRGCLFALQADKQVEALADLRRLCEVVNRPADPRVESALAVMARILGGEEGENRALEADLGPVSEAPVPGTEGLEEDLVRVAQGRLQAAAVAGMDDADLGHMAETGFTLLENGRLADADAVFSGLVTLDPTVALFRIALGNVCEQMEDDDRALEAYDAAVRIVEEFDGEGTHDNAFDAYYHRGKFHLRVGHGEPALADLRKAIEIDPDAEKPLTQHAAVLVSAMLTAAEEQAG